MVTGLYWLAERLYFLPRRRLAAERLEANAAQRRADLAAQGITQVDGDVAQARQRLLMQPWWLDWTAGLFPVILAVFVLRSFLFEPFKIPSGSMIPTLLVGDLILVNKFTYGIRLPVLNTKLTEGTSAAARRRDGVPLSAQAEPGLHQAGGRRAGRRGGLPEQEAHDQRPAGEQDGRCPTSSTKTRCCTSSSSRKCWATGGTGSSTTTTARPSFPASRTFPSSRIAATVSRASSARCPQGHYFMMGDNRDNSLDSRYWGFVPDKNIVGKAFFIWMNFGSLKRIGSFE